MYLVLGFTMPTGKALSKWSLKKVSMQKMISMRICGLETGALADIPFSERFIFLPLYFVKSLRHCIFINVEQLDLELFVTNYFPMLYKRIRCNTDSTWVHLQGFEIFSRLPRHWWSWINPKSTRGVFLHNTKSWKELSSFSTFVHQDSSFFDIWRSLNDAE